MEIPAFDHEILQPLRVLPHIKTLITHTYSCRYHAAGIQKRRRQQSHADTMVEDFENMHIAE